MPRQRWQRRVIAQILLGKMVEHRWAQALCMVNSRSELVLQRLVVQGEYLTAPLQAGYKALALAGLREETLVLLVHRKPLERVTQSNRQCTAFDQQFAQHRLVNIGNPQYLRQPLGIQRPGRGPQACQQVRAALPLQRAVDTQPPATLTIAPKRRAINLCTLAVQQPPVTLGILAHRIKCTVVMPPKAAVSAEQTIMALAHQQLCGRFAIGLKVVAP